LVIQEEATLFRMNLFIFVVVLVLVVEATAKSELRRKLQNRGGCDDGSGIGGNGGPLSQVRFNKVIFPNISDLWDLHTFQSVTQLRN
jgi:hypothetical protein